MNAVTVSSIAAAARWISSRSSGFNRIKRFAVRFAIRREYATRDMQSIASTYAPVHIFLRGH
jgi:hypothetical protein